MSFTKSPGKVVSGYGVVHAGREFQSLPRQFAAFVVPDPDHARYARIQVCALTRVGAERGPGD